MTKYLTCLFLLISINLTGFAQLTSNSSSLSIGQFDSRTTQIRIPIINQSREKVYFLVYGGGDQTLVSIPKSIKSYEEEFFLISPSSIFSNKHFKLKLNIESKTGKTVVTIKGKLKGANGNQDCYDFDKNNNKVKSNARHVPQIVQSKPIRLYNKSDRDVLYASDPMKHPYAHLVALVDASGSMGGKDKLNNIKSNLKALVKEMRPTDYLSILRYADESELVLDKISCSEIELINQSIENIEAGGFTNGKEGIESAMNQSRLQQDESHSNHVIMFTDGNFNLGEEQEGIRRYLLGQNRTMTYKFSVLSIDSDSENEKEMKALTQTGGGYYFNLDQEKVNPKSLNKLLLKQLSAQK